MENLGWQTTLPVFSYFGARNTIAGSWSFPGAAGQLSGPSPGRPTSQPEPFSWLTSQHLQPASYTLHLQHRSSPPSRSAHFSPFNGDSRSDLNWSHFSTQPRPPAQTRLPSTVKQKPSSLRAMMCFLTCSSNVRWDKNNRFPCANSRVLLVANALTPFQGSRLDDQRCAAPSATPAGPTVPDDDFFSLILRSQSNRMEEQRVPPPTVTQSKPDWPGL